VAATILVMIRFVKNTGIFNARFVVAVPNKSVKSKMLSANSRYALIILFVDGMMEKV
jgi:hypothetical protein